jgi:hypothetical protein
MAFFFFLFSFGKIIWGVVVANPVNLFFQLKPAASELNYSKIKHQTIHKAPTPMAHNAKV